MLVHLKVSLMYALINNFIQHELLDIANLPLYLYQN